MTKPTLMTFSYTKAIIYVYLPFLRLKQLYCRKQYSYNIYCF